MLQARQLLCLEAETAKKETIRSVPAPDDGFALRAGRTPDVELMRLMRRMVLEDRSFFRHPDTGNAGYRQERKRDADEQDEMLGTNPGRVDRKRRKWSDGCWFAALLAETSEVEVPGGEDGLAADIVDGLFASWIT